MRAWWLLLGVVAASQRLAYSAFPARVWERDVLILQRVHHYSERKVLTRREPGMGLAVLYEYADNANTRLQ